MRACVYGCRIYRGEQVCTHEAKSLLSLTELSASLECLTEPTLHCTVCVCVYTRARERKITPSDFSLFLPLFP